MGLNESMLTCVLSLTLSHILRPGGIYLTVEGEIIAFDEEKKYLPLLPVDDPRHSYWADLLYLTNKAMRARLGNIDAPSLIETWLREHHAFETVNTHEIWLPSGPWFPPSMYSFCSAAVLLAQRFHFFLFLDTVEGDHLNHIGKLAQTDLSVRLYLALISVQIPITLLSSSFTQTFVSSARPLILSNGMSEKDTETLIANARKELENIEKRTYLKVTYIWATKVRPAAV